MHDFDKQRKRIQRQGRIIRLFALGWMVFVALLIIGGIGGAIYLAATTDASELAKDAGSLVRDFNEGMEGND